MVVAVARGPALRPTIANGASAVALAGLALYTTSPAATGVGREMGWRPSLEASDLYGVLSSLRNDIYEDDERVKSVNNNQITEVSH